MTLIKQIAGLFKTNLSHGPLPDSNQCYSLAVLIRNIRASESYKKNFEQQNLLLNRRRAVVEAMKRLVKQRRDELDGFLSHSIKFPDWVQQADDLASLSAALEKAAPALLGRSDTLAGQRKGGWWHKAARSIAERAEAALRQAGHKKISSQKHGAFVGVVAGALKLATGIDFEPGTVAAVLNNQPTLDELAG